MKKLILILPLLYYSCTDDIVADIDALKTENQQQDEQIDSLMTALNDQQAYIDLEFVVLKHFETESGTLAALTEVISDDCPSDNPSDCAGVCGGDAVIQTYYHDYDSDGLGGDYNMNYCSANVPDNWVLNSDDDDDTTTFCWILNTLNIFEEDLEVTDGYISFTHNQEDYSIDVSTCIEIEGESGTTRLIQDTELEVIYAFEENGIGLPFNYSSPNELLYVK